MAGITAKAIMEIQAPVVSVTTTTPIQIAIQNSPLAMRRLRLTPLRPRLAA